MLLGPTLYLVNTNLVWQLVEKCGDYANAISGLQHKVPIFDKKTSLAVRKTRRSHVDVALSDLWPPSAQLRLTSVVLFKQTNKPPSPPPQNERDPLCDVSLSSVVIKHWKLKHWLGLWGEAPRLIYCCLNAIRPSAELTTDIATHSF